MKIGAWQIVGLIGLITGCAGFFPDIPGYFYEFQLTETPPATVCSDLSSYLASKFVLHIDDVLQPPPGQCIAIMESANHSPHVEVDLGSAMRERTVALGIEQRGFGRAIEPSKETDELAVQIVAAIHEKLPVANMKQVRRQYGPFAP